MQLDKLTQTEKSNDASDQWIEKYLSFCDIILIDENTGKNWPMVSVILKMKSKYFEALLSNNWNPLNKITFKIHFDSNDVANKIMIWFFTGKLFLQHHQFHFYDKIIEFASYYQCDDLLIEVVDQLNNIKNILIHHDTIPEFGSKFYDFLIQNRKTVLNSFSLFDPHYSLLSRIVQSENYHKNSLLGNSHWAIKSADFNYQFESDFSNGKKFLSCKQNKQIEIKLIHGIKFKPSFIKACGPNLLNFEIYGSNNDDQKDSQPQIDFSSNEFYSKFFIKLIKNNSKEDLIVLTLLQFHGNVIFEPNFTSFDE